MKRAGKKIRKETFSYNVISICFTGILIILIFLLFTSCRSVAPAKRYSKTHSENNFYDRLNGNESFTKKSLNNDLKNAKKNNRDKRNDERDSTKIANKLARIEEIKNNN
jgi:hypothetical protein